MGWYSSGRVERSVRKQLSTSGPAKRARTVLNVISLSQVTITLSHILVLTKIDKVSFKSRLGH